MSIIRWGLIVWAILSILAPVAWVLFFNHVAAKEQMLQEDLERLREMWAPAAHEFRDSTAWCRLHGVSVLDPDGWDRTNFVASWNEPITEETFWDRYSRSTGMLMLTQPTQEESTP